MKLGIKIHIKMFEDITQYREALLKFDVFYVNARIYYKDKRDVLKNIYKYALDNNKELYGYYMLSGRLEMPHKPKNLTETKQYVKDIFREFPYINNWEIAHETFEDSGKTRDNNLKKSLGDKWARSAYRLIKNEYPDKSLFYSDFVLNEIKAKYVINFVNEIDEIDGFNLQNHCDILHIPETSLIRGIYKGINKRLVSLENSICLVKQNNIPYLNDRRHLLAFYLKRQAYNFFYTNNDVSENIQAARYKQSLKLAEDNGVEIYGFWSLTDRPEDTYTSNNFQYNPGLLRENFEPKPAYTKIFSP